jgi:hypothetical protein
MQFAAKFRWKILAVFVTTSLAGCAPEAARLGQRIPHPGPVAYQRDQAIKHDPYPLDDVGPEIVGGRPREYQRPLNEVVRAEMDATVPPGVIPPRPPGMSVAPGYPAPATVLSPIAPAPAAAPYPVTPVPTVPAPQPAPFQYQQRPPY